MKKYILLSLMFGLSVLSSTAQNRVRVAVPNTQKIVKDALAKSRAKRSNTKRTTGLSISVPTTILAKMMGYCGTSVATDSISAIASADSCSAETKAAMKESLSKTKGNEITTLDVLNMILPGAFTEKEKEQWQALPTETRQAVVSSVLETGPTQWDMMNDAQKAVIHEESNGK